MPLNPSNTRNFYRRLYAGEMETVTLHKRGDNQQQGTVVSHLIFNARRGDIAHHGETIRGSMQSSDQTYWVIPTEELNRVGVNYLSPLDVIEQENGQRWQPEGTTTIMEKTFSNYYYLACRRLN